MWYVRTGNGQWQDGQPTDGRPVLLTAALAPAGALLLIPLLALGFLAVMVVVGIFLLIAAGLVVARLFVTGWRRVTSRSPQGDWSRPADDGRRNVRVLHRDER